MEVRLAKTAGFCFGVKRAVETVYEQVKEKRGSRIYTYGPIIHNQEVVRDLENRGVQVLHTMEELKGLAEGTVIIRSHGVAKEVYELLEAQGIHCVDATCPFVKKIHNIVEKESAKGAAIVIVGDPAHPEVQGICGWAEGSVAIVKTEADAEAFAAALETEVCIVAQTTFNYNKFKDLVEIIKKKGYNVRVLNTICGATKERQTEAAQIASEVDAMIVIGDKHSSNTQKLFEICRNACKDTYYIQTLEDLHMERLQSVKTVGITAGASTPNNIIEEVQSNVRLNF
ncbi:MAG: 4-hydroxy-3-methylbut-2-enyl diphosphate reductase [Faecalimonas sp.]|nr:4-hydroxy-3-methylbut-2-enyl diphosphate reductase [Faecalimonas sp.]